jgi:Mn2+/Fe2+ NRAMP family transporter
MLNSSVSLLTAVVTGIVVFFFTVAWVAMKGARDGYRKAKAAVVPARKSMWSAIGSLFKIAVLVAILALILVAWQANDLAGVADEKPSPSPSVRHT